MRRRTWFMSTVLVALASFGTVGAWAQGGVRARLAFIVDNDVYRVDDDGRGLRNLTETPTREYAPSWYDPSATLALSNAGKLLCTWGWLKGGR